MNNEIEITIKGQTKKYEKKVSLVNIYNDFKNLYKYPPLVAKVNNKIKELNEEITETSNIEFIDHCSKLGNRIYTNGLYFILIKAYKEVLGDDKDLTIEHSLDEGTYIKSKETLTQQIVNKIKEVMKEIVESDYKIKRSIVDIDDAISYFNRNNQKDKIELLNYITSDVITLYKLDNLYDYFHTKMPISTAPLNKFNLTLTDENGMVLTYPTEHRPDSIKEYSHPEKMFQIFKEYSNWIKIMGLKNAPALNKLISQGKGEELIKVTEASQNKKISDIADTIESKINDLKLILIAGPSSSGKTTTSKKIALHLKAKGITPRNLSTDDYYVERVDTPKDESGDYDYETIDAIDIGLFNEHLTRLINGEEVITPSYNFLTGKKEFDERNKIKLREKEVLIIEGIHGHNEKLTGNIKNSNKFKIYISPLTQINIDNHNRVHTTDVRLLRRMIRDYKYRGYKPEETLEEWKDVRAGEEKWIFPYQNTAEVILNSALIYEIAVLKPYAEPLLYSIPKTSREYPEAKRLIYFLRNFLSLNSESVPGDSHLREFIGGSSFREEK